MPPGRVAAIAYGWTPRVSVTDDGEVLAEIGGSARLFGGLEAIRVQVERLTPRFALAPTPQAALWLAYGAPGAWVESPARLAGALGKIPVRALGLDEGLTERLAGFGMHRLGDVLRLPRAALARRTGVDLNEALARALGERADPRAGWKPPPRFSERVELGHESDDAGMLVRLATPLFEGLAIRLRATGHGVRRCTVVLDHAGGTVTRIRIGTLEAVRDAARLCGQFALQLERMALPAPVRAVGLYASRFEPVEEVARDLFAPRASGEGWSAARERMQARLGARAVFGVCPQADHRPEMAWVIGATVGAPPIRREWPGSCTDRPFWLLSEPRPAADLRVYTFERGPERIESGWWDGADVMRDYFVARDRAGARCWLFHERRAPYGWYLHGLFG